MKNLIVASRVFIIIGVLPYVFLVLLGVVSLVPLSAHILLLLSTMTGVLCGLFVLNRVRKNPAIIEERELKLKALKWLLIIGFVDIAFVAFVVIIGISSLLRFEEHSDERAKSPEFCGIAVVDPSLPLPRDAEHRKVFLESVCTIPVKIEKIEDPKHCTIAVVDPSAPLKTDEENYVDWLTNTSGCTKVDIVAR